MHAHSPSTDRKGRTEASVTGQNGSPQHLQEGLGCAFWPQPLGQGKAALQSPPLAAAGNLWATCSRKDTCILMAFFRSIWNHRRPVRQGPVTVRSPTPFLQQAANCNLITQSLWRAPRWSTLPPASQARTRVSTLLPGKGSFQPQGTGCGSSPMPGAWVVEAQRQPRRLADKQPHRPLPAHPGTPISRSDQSRYWFPPSG